MAVTATELVAPRGPVTLDDGIAQQINLGEKDPLTIARKMASLYGGDWVAEQLASHWEEIIAEIARQKLGNDRRSAVVSLGEFARSGKKHPTKREAVLTSVFIPSKGYISLGDATDADLAEAAAYRRRLADGLVRWADWFDSVRDALAAQGVARVRDLRGALPGLPQQEIGEAS